VNGLNLLDEEHDGFAGHVSPATAWGCLAENADAVLVDVRTQAEWVFVGLPDLTNAAARLVCMEWQRFPEMAVNPDFVKKIAQEIADTTPAIFTLCRSGVRSIAAARALTQKVWRVATMWLAVLKGIQTNLDIGGVLTAGSLTVYLGCRSNYWRVTELGKARIKF